MTQIRIHSGACRSVHISSGQKSKGFTLLEVLIAIGITAMIGLGSWQILSSALKTNESTQLRLKELNALQRTMLIIGRDFKQIAPRSTRNEYGDYGYALDTNEEFYIVEFTRGGWRNPLNDKRSSLQRVAYELEEEKLVRHHWYVLDKAQDSESYKRTLMRGVESFKLKFMNEEGGWVNNWPTDDSEQDEAEGDSDPRKANNAVPKAIKLEIDSVRFGKITRLFETGQALAGSSIKTEESSSDNEDSDNSSGNSDNSNDASQSDGADSDESSSDE